MNWKLMSNLTPEELSVTNKEASIIMLDEDVDIDHVRDILEEPDSKFMPPVQLFWLYELHAVIMSHHPDFNELDLIDLIKEIS